MSALSVRKHGDDRLGTCLSHIMSLTSSLKLYCADFDGRLPQASYWPAPLGPYVENAHAFTCPEVKTTRLAFALNSRLAASSLSSVVQPGEVVLVFERSLGWNPVGGRETLPDEPRHLGRDTYGFVDGHARYVPRKRLPDGTWAKEPAREGVIWEPVLKGSDVGETGTSSGSTASE